MKQFVVTEAELNLLLTTLETHKFKGSSYLYSQIQVQAERLRKDKIEQITIENMILDESYRYFLYYVVGWINKIKE